MWSESANGGEGKRDEEETGRRVRKYVVALTGRLMD